MPVGLIALMLPISISGFGAPQGLIVWMMSPLGVPEADAFALSTLIVLSGIIANAPGALLYLRRVPREPAPKRTLTLVSIPCASLDLYLRSVNT